MTLDDLDRKTLAMQSLRAEREARTLPVVARKVADAHAHAAKALTDTLKATDDGRDSIRKINRSPSFLAAMHRLDELWAWLAGPSEVSLRGEIRDARQAFLTLAAGLWHPLIPAEMRSRSEPSPPASQVKAIRAAAIHGHDPRKFLEGPIANAKRTLRAAIEQAARKGTAEATATDTLGAWETRTASALTQAVTTLLGDSAEYADQEAGRGLIHPRHIAGPAEEIATDGRR